MLVAPCLLPTSGDTGHQYEPAVCPQSLVDTRDWTNEILFFSCIFPMNAYPVRLHVGYFYYCPFTVLLTFSLDL